MARKAATAKEPTDKIFLTFAYIVGEGSGLKAVKRGSKCRQALGSARNSREKCRGSRLLGEDLTERRRSVRSPRAVQTIKTRGL